MNLSFGREMAAIPGPSIIPDRVLAAMAQPMRDLYEGPVVEISRDIRRRLPALARTEGHAFPVIGNGHAAWQMATSNTLARGDKVLVCESGRFASIWGEQTVVSNIEIDTLAQGDRNAVDPAALEEHLRADTNHEIRAVLCVHVDTASSVRNDIPALRAAIDDAAHPALLMVDCIASLGCEAFHMDDWGVDIAVAGSQKGLMVPPGMSFVWASDKAVAAYDRADQRVGYFDWDRRINGTSEYHFYSGTPPIPHLAGLQVALDMIDEEGGLDAVWARHQVLGDAVRAAVEAWSTPDGIAFNIVDPSHRSNCVTTVLTGGLDAAALRSRLSTQTGLVVGLGIADVPGIRIAHMGHLNPPMILGTLATIEAALLSFDAPIGSSGITAAAEIVASALRP